jgi:hypothetical protein
MYVVYHSEDNIVVDLRQIGLYGVDWTYLSQERLQWRAFVNTVINILFSNRYMFRSYDRNI